VVDRSGVGPLALALTPVVDLACPRGRELLSTRWAKSVYINTEYAIELLSWHSLISSRELSSSMHRDRKECKARIHQLSEYGKLPQVIVDRITSKLNFEQLQERM